MAFVLAIPSMIRRFDRFYAKHPNIAFAVMAVICAVVLYVAYSVDSDNTAVLQLRMMNSSRAAT
jgi:hypothetical protein